MRGVFLHTARSLLAFVPESALRTSGIEPTAQRPRPAGSRVQPPAPAPRRSDDHTHATSSGRSASGYRAGVRAVTPLIPAVIAFGVSFGVLAQAADMGAGASLVMSATTFAGSAQFAVVSVLGAGGTTAAAIVAAVLLNARYGPMGLAAADVFKGGPLRRALEAQLLVDESWALSNRDGRFDRRIMLGAGAFLYVGWNTGTAVGVVAGDSLADPATLGLDAAFPALFLALLAPLLRSRTTLAAAFLGAAIALALTPITPAGVPVIAATAACLVGLARPRSLPAGAQAGRGDAQAGRGGPHAEHPRDPRPQEAST
jgi:4-azaleucine resistance transporter AzlC